MQKTIDSNGYKNKKTICSNFLAGEQLAPSLI